MDKLFSKIDVGSYELKLVLENKKNDIGDLVTTQHLWRKLCRISVHYQNNIDNEEYFTLSTNLGLLSVFLKNTLIYDKGRLQALDASGRFYGWFQMF